MEPCKVCSTVHPEGRCPATPFRSPKPAAKNLEDEKLYLRVEGLGEEDAVAFLDEPALGKRFPLPFPVCRVGRSKTSDLVIPRDFTISRTHFTIVYAEGRFLLLDGGSRNGTYVNGNRVNDKVELENGDRIRAGRFGLSFTIARDRLERRRVLSTVLPQSVQMHSDEQAEIDPRETMDLTLSATQRLGLNPGSRASEPATRPAPAAANDGPLPGADLERPSAAKRLAALHAEMADLQKQQATIEARIMDCQARIDATREEASASSEVSQDELLAACAKAFYRLGWEVDCSDSNRDLILKRDGKPQAVARASAGGLGQARIELGKLVNFQVSYWTSEPGEPKGILVIHSPPGDTINPQQRQDLERYADEMKVCLLTTAGLKALCQLARDDGAQATVRQAILTTSGSQARQGESS